jgi:hypothetical protein
MVDAIPQPNAPARTVDAGRGLAWWNEAWALFARSALLWVALGLMVIVGFAVIGFVPLLGTLVTALLMPVVIGGWVIAARKVSEGGVLEVADLFSGFHGERLTPLIVLGVVFLVASALMVLVAFVLGAGAVFGLFRGGANPGGAAVMGALGTGFVALLVVMLLGMLATAALWFAPALVVFRQTPPLEAAKISLAAVFQNWVPFLVFGLIHILLSIVASIPLMLGWLVLVPVLLLTTYVSYRDVFEPA